MKRERNDNVGQKDKVENFLIINFFKNFTQDKINKQAQDNIRQSDY